MSKTKSNVFFLAISQGTNYLLPLLIYPYLVRVIGVVNFGNLSFSLITIQILLLIVEYGFGYSATKEIALNNNKRFHFTLFSGVILARFILMFITLAILTVICLIPVFNDIKSLLYIGFLTVIAGVFNPNWYLQGREMMGIMAALSLFSRALAVVAIYIYVNPNTPIYVSAYLLTTPYLIYSLCGVIYLLYTKEVRFLISAEVNVIKILRKGFHFFCSTLATSAYTMLVPVILGSVSGKLDVGIFNSANVIKQGLAGLASPIVQAFYPAVNRLYKKDSATANSRVMKILKYMTLFYIILAIPFLFFAKPIAIIIFGSKGNEIYEAMQLMSLLPVFIGFNTVAGLLILVPNGMTKQYFKAILAGAIICLIITYPFCKYFGAIGAIISLMAAEVFVGVGMLTNVIRIRRSNRV